MKELYCRIDRNRVCQEDRILAKQVARLAAKDLGIDRPEIRWIEHLDLGELLRRYAGNEKAVGLTMKQDEICGYVTKGRPGEITLVEPSGVDPSARDLLRTVAHEVRHCWQMERGYLEAWTEDRYERDARKYARSFARRMRGAP